MSILACSPFNRPHSNKILASSLPKKSRKQIVFVTVVYNFNVGLFLSRWESLNISIPQRLFYRRLLKNSLSSAEHSSASTPPVTSTL